MILSEKGWIKLDRQLQDNWLWKIKPFSKAQAWVDLIMMVNHKDAKVPMGNEVLEIKRGSKPVGLRQLGEKWGWSKNKVSDFLNVLEKDSMITQERTTKGTVVTLINYDQFQFIEDTKRKQKGNESESNRKRIDPNKNDKECIKNDNKKDMPLSGEEKLPEGAEVLPDGTVSYANVKRNWD